MNLIEYLESVAVLADELDSIAQVLMSLSPDEWSSPTLLVPVEPVPPWTVLQLTGHLGFAMNMVETLLSQGSGSPPELDRVSFFDQERDRIAPLAYRTARDVSSGKSNAEILDLCLASFSTAVERARLADPGSIGPAVLGAMRIDEFIVTRLVEAVVHGLDLAQALNRPARRSAVAVDSVADVLDSINHHRRNRSRPRSLADNWLWVQVASGRRRHDDFPTPLLS